METTYDYVVVGAGTAGCVLATRLSEDPAVGVLLLEAGDRSPAEAPPPVWPTLQGTSADWAGVSVPQAATGGVVPWPRGRGVGGSSAINGMVFTRGHRSSYDAWAAAGATGWGFEDLLPYFRRSENAPGRDPATRGVDGPLTVAPASPGHPVAQALLAAAQQTGYPVVPDLNAGLDEGFGWSDLNIVDGRRQSAADAYLAPALPRPNLTLVTDALAHRLLTTGGRCTAVQYGVGSEVFTARADREIVLTAGTVGSALLLMLSGIGPAAHLRQLGIEVVADLPGVGSNLQDHPRSTVIYSAARPLPTGRTNRAEVAGLVRSDPSAAAPDLQLQLVDMPYYAPALPPSIPGTGEGWSIGISAMTPRSRGAVRLTAASPDAPPRLDPNYYGDPHDVAVMTAGLRIARTIGTAPALDSWRGAEVLPGPAVQDPAEVRDYLFQSLRTYSHQVGTCRIGLDDRAVVDPQLRVRGIDALRVADASVMPTIVSGNTNATVCGIAERAAALITGQTD
ncbi:GMC family oxidoreductase [Dactylosporangium darangshiense]|uniref:GMC family oxidoreductase n=1 Tax=Dactylosporangium darangshiense TaxID=579108 RepID=UPI003645E1F4